MDRNPKSLGAHQLARGTHLHVPKQVGPGKRNATKIRPPHDLGGVPRRDARYSSRRAPYSSRCAPREPVCEARYRKRWRPTRWTRSQRGKQQLAGSESPLKRTSAGSHSYGYPADIGEMVLMRRRTYLCVPARCRSMMVPASLTSAVTKLPSSMPPVLISSRSMGNSFSPSGVASLISFFI